MLREALISLPRTARILCRLDEDYSGYAFKILQWLAYSFSPLTWKQLAEIVAIDATGDLGLDPDSRLTEMLNTLTICASLITVDDIEASQVEHSDVVSDPSERLDKAIVRLAHFSVKEYLVSTRIQEGPAKRYSMQEEATHQSISNDCISYILVLEPWPDNSYDYTHLSSISSEVFNVYPLAWYAVHWWHQHAKVAEKGSNYDCNVIMKLYRTEKAMLIWTLLSGYNSEIRHRDESGRLQPPDPIYLASTWGLTKSVSALLDDGADVQGQGGEFDSALQVASYYGHTDTVQLLLDNDAPVDGQAAIHGSALQIASSEGHVDIVRQLLHKGAHIAGDNKHDNALSLASENDHVHIVKMLLDYSVDANITEEILSDALLAAICGDSLETVKLLLDRGANPNHVLFENGLEFLATHGWSDAVKTLNDHGANTNNRNRRNTVPALQLAAGGDQAPIVQLLLGNGAHVNARTEGVTDSIDGDALLHASMNENENVVEILLEAGADVNAHHEQLKCKNALHAAAYPGEEGIVKILLDAGANVNDDLDFDYGSLALQAATGKNYSPEIFGPIARLLRERGAILPSKT